MTVLRRMVLGYAALIFMVIVLVGVGAGAVLWINSWQSGFTRAAERVEGANQVEVRSLSMLGDSTGLNTTSLITLGSYGQIGDEASGYLGEAGAELTPVLDSLAALEPTGSEGAAAVENIRVLVTQHQQAAEAAYVVAATNVAQGLADITEKVIPVALQVREAATAYRESAKAQQTDELDSLARIASLVVIVMVIVGVLAIAGGVLAVVALTRTIGRQLRGAVSSISTSAAEMLAVSSQVAAGAAQTAASTNETTATVEEVKQTALLAHEKATQVAENSENVAQGSRDRAGEDRRDHRRHRADAGPDGRGG